MVDQVGGTSFGEGPKKADKELNFKKLELKKGSVFISDDNNGNGKVDNGEGVVSINDIAPEYRTQSTLELLKPYLGKEWTQDIIDDLTKQIKEIGKKNIEKETANEQKITIDENGWAVVNQDKSGNNKDWMNVDGTRATQHKSYDGQYYKYSTGKETIGTYFETHNVKDVVYEENTNRIKQYTDVETGLTVTNTYDKDGKTIRTFSKNGQPTTADVKVINSQTTIKNVASIERDKYGNEVAYTVSDGEVNGEKATNIHYAQKFDKYRGQNLGFVVDEYTNKNGETVKIKRNDWGDVEQEIYVNNKHIKTIRNTAGKEEGLYARGEISYTQAREEVYYDDNGNIKEKIDYDKNNNVVAVHTAVKDQKMFGNQVFTCNTVDGVKTKEVLNKKGTRIAWGGGGNIEHIPDSGTTDPTYIATYDSKHRATKLQPCYEKGKIDNRVAPYQYQYPDNNTVVQTHELPRSGHTQTTTYNLKDKTYTFVEKDSEGNETHHYTEKLSQERYEQLIFKCNLPLPEEETKQ